MPAPVEAGGGKEGLRNRVRTGLLWTISGGSTVALLRIGTLIVLARLLTPAEFGTMTAALVVVKLSGIFVYMGIGPAIVQLPELTERHKTTGMLASLAFSLIVQAAVWVLAPFIASFFGSAQLIPILRAISFVFLIRGISTVSSSVLHRDLRFKDLAKYEVVSYLLGSAVVTIALAAAGAGAWSLALGYLAYVLINATQCLLARPSDWRAGAGWKELRDLLRFGTGVTLARVAAYMAGNADNIVVGRFLGLSALGFYGRAYGLTSSAETLTGGVVDKVFFPAIARVQGDQSRLRKGYHDGQSAIALGALPISALLVILAPEAVLVLLGDDWSEVIPLFQVLAAGLLFRTGYGIAMSVIRATGAVYRLARIQLVYAVAVLTGALIGQFWGLQGVAFGILAAMVSGYLVAARTAMRITEFGWHDIYEMHETGLRIALVVGSLCWVVAGGLRWLNVPAIGVLAAGILVLSLVTLMLARKRITQLLGVDPITELRGMIAKRRSSVQSL